MTSRATSIVPVIVRVWTRCYTCCLEPSVRDARRAEIESDLYEQLHSDASHDHFVDMLGRLLCGIPDDLRWTIEQSQWRWATVGPTMLAAVGVVAVIVTLWAVEIVRTANLPTDPGRPQTQWRGGALAPPPPPPPPPICKPGVEPSYATCTPWPARR
jgi:hypothetical protein